MIGLFKKYPVLANVLLFVGLILVTVLVVVVPQIRKVKSSPDSIVIDPKSIDAKIESYTKAIQDNPEVITSYISLSQAYLQKIRDTADVAYYQKISDLLEWAENIDPKNSNIPALRASVEIGRHHFKEGKAFAEVAISLNPYDHLNFGLLGDALIELGQYKEAVESFQKMIDLRPDYSSYIRIAYARELYGDIQGAKVALRQAISAGSSFKENVAFAYVELGKLDMRTDLDLGAKDFNDALRLVPDYPTALEGLGKVAYFKGDSTTAESYFSRAYNKLPIVQYAVDLGDLARTKGDEVKAKQYYELARLAFKKSSQSGVNTDLEESLFLSDHDIDLENSLSMAKRAFVERPSIYSADYLSWALYKNGQFKESINYAKDALRLGETDPLILFHQGMIAKKNGDNITAKKYLLKSMNINPYFSILDSIIIKEELKNL